jgi:rhodanese-related sulfurtransferase/DNA-binding transcriptional ArsR family regulator
MKGGGARVHGREVKDRLCEAFARTARAAANPKRIELLALMAQGERTVEALAQAAGMGVKNVPAHLQVLARSRLTTGRRQGTKVFYLLGGDDVAAFVVAVRDLARSRLAEAGQVVRGYFLARDALEPVSRAELAGRARDGQVVILDVRPVEEFAAGHIPGALSVPLAGLDDASAWIPGRAEIVAYCRGPYCVLAAQAAGRLRAHGYRARRLAGGLPEWRLAGLPVAAGLEDFA